MKEFTWSQGEKPLKSFFGRIAERLDQGLMNRSRDTLAVPGETFSVAVNFHLAHTKSLTVLIRLHLVLEEGDPRFRGDDFGAYENVLVAPA